MATSQPPPADDGAGRGYGGYWAKYDRPFQGCGCLYVLVALVLVWWLVSWLFFPSWQWW